MPDNHDAGSELTLDGLAQEVGGLRELLEQTTRRDEIQKQAFETLYEELRQYKEDFIFQAEKPLLLDLLLFYDSLNWFQQSLLKQEMNPDVITDSFQYLLDEFLELLYRRDVLPMDSRTRFDKRNQKAIKVLPTDDATLDYQVHEVIKRGFTRNSRTLRPEEVVIWRLQNESAARPERDPSEATSETDPIAPESE